MQQKLKINKDIFIFYEPTLNVVIEWDEHWRHNRNKNNDQTREENIKNVLECKFIRIKETSDYESTKNFILNNL